ncbi:DUF1735 domain-containing protein [Dyadobacter subterraneus]|uniref:DUF1735 domain-containing protein n=1 Tax=Dyadobacter subterraneus TaxID=2773304 RepID=A0ABR9WL41_9BACT|nr:DUF1735 domain-containing protein [Dyadobacter subterraneus]MBE9464884.1 DUF1735 domain-containing protein [Dyadobacter subterraneus]
MKRSIIKSIFFLAAAFSLTSCLDGDDQNIPADSSQSILELLYVPPGGTTINSGLTYYADAALTYPATDEADTATFVVSLQGSKELSKDLTINLVVDANAANDNFASDSIDYKIMPDSLFTLISKTAVIKAGQRSAEFKVIFYPSKINATENYALPVTATNDGNIDISSNFGHIYFHAIGNPIGGAYSWNYDRYNSQDKSGAYSGFQDATIFSPVNPTTVKAESGYLAVHYLISFTNTDGILSDFSAVIDPDDVADIFAANTVTIITAPTITVSENNTKFVLNYVVFNGTAYRNISDTFYK